MEFVARTAFQNVDDQGIDGRVLNRARRVIKPVSVSLVDVCVNHLFSVTDNRKIWVVRHQHDLAAGSSEAEARHEQSVHGFVI